MAQIYLNLRGIKNIGKIFAIFRKLVKADIYYNEKSEIRSR